MARYEETGTGRLLSTPRRAVTGLLFATGRTNAGFAPRTRTRPEMTIHAIVGIRGRHADLTRIPIRQPAPRVTATRPGGPAGFTAHVLRLGSRRQVGPDYQTNLESHRTRRRKCLSKAKIRPGTRAPATEDRSASGALPPGPQPRHLPDRTPPASEQLYGGERHRQLAVIHGV
jgi:hypothetical protein